MDDVRTLDHCLRRRREVTCVVDSIVARRAAHRLSAKMARTAVEIASLANAAVTATVEAMWFGIHLEGPCDAPD